MMEGTQIHKVLGCPREFAENLKTIPDPDFRSKVIKMVMVGHSMVTDLIETKKALQSLVDYMDRMKLDDEQRAAVRAARKRLGQTVELPGGEV